MIKKLSLCCALVLLLSAAPCAGAEQAVELPILMYHHISTDPASWGSYVVSPETFEDDLRLLSTLGYTSISLEELIAYTDGRGALPEKAVMITFDDGQRSFAEYAVPLLEKYDMCAVAAIVGRYADDYTASGETNVSYAYMGWPELADIASDPHVELQAHSYDMHSLGSRRGCGIASGESEADYKRMFSRDLSRVLSCFSEHLGKAPAGFAYPFGIRTQACAEILINAGCRALFTCDERPNHITRDPACLYSLGRYNRPNDAERYALFARMGIK